MPRLCFVLFSLCCDGPERQAADEAINLSRMREQQYRNQQEMLRLPCWRCLPDVDTLAVFLSCRRFPRDFAAEGRASERPETAVMGASGVSWVHLPA